MGLRITVGGKPDSDGDGIPNSTDPHPHFNQFESREREMRQAFISGWLAGVATPVIITLLAIVFWP